MVKVGALHEALGGNKVFHALVACGGKVESTKDDFPCKIDGVPELRVVETKGDHVLPEFLDVSSVSCKNLKAGASRGTEIRGKLVECGT